MLEIEEVTEQSRWESLKDDWNRALRESESDSVFLTHEWLSTWWDHFGAGKELLVLVARDQGKIRGLAPLMRSTRRYAGMPVRKVEFIGEKQANMLDFILGDGEASRAVAQAMISHILASSRKCIIDLRNVPALSAVRKAASEAGAEDPSLLLREELCDTFRISLEGGWDDYLKTRKSHLRRNIRRVDRLLSEVGDIKADTFTRPADVQRVFKDVIGVDERNPGSEKGLSVAISSSDRVFYQDLVSRLGTGSGSHLSLLKVDGEHVAYEFSLVFKGVVFGIIKAYDMSFRRVSPGIGLSTRVLQNLFANGAREMDLYRGDHEYKHRWATETRQLVRLMMFRRSPYSRLLFWLWPRFRDFQSRKTASGPS